MAITTSNSIRVKESIPAGQAVLKRPAIVFWNRVVPSRGRHANDRGVIIMLLRSFLSNPREEN
jgi:hypothetical protein